MYNLIFILHGGKPLGEFTAPGIPRIGDDIVIDEVQYTVETITWKMKKKETTEECEEPQVIYLDCI